MARQPRQQSGTVIYHIMMRGINKQIIFEEDGDYRYFRLSPKSQLKSLPIIGEDSKASNDALVGSQQKLLALEFLLVAFGQKSLLLWTQWEK